MTYWSIVLHFYQPPTQDLRITKSILTFCYLPLLRMLHAKKGYGITLNISGSLLEQLQKLEATEFFNLIKDLVADGRVELTNSLMYHSLSPITPPEIFERQTEKNRLQIKEALGIEKLSGFFPPELAIDKESLDLIHSTYVIVDQSAVTAYPIAKYEDNYLLVINRELTETLRSYPQQLRASAFIPYALTKIPDESLCVLACDGEVFGHHYTERLKLLSDILDEKDIRCIRASEAVEHFKKTASTVRTIKHSTWQNTTGLELWTGNALQKKYLQFANLVSKLTKDSEDKKLQELLDKGWSSCYFYWLSNLPWWHPDFVVKGARCLIRSVRHSQIPNAEKRSAEALYHALLNDIWQYHWTEKVEAGYRRHDTIRAKMLAKLPKI